MSRKDQKIISTLLSDKVPRKYQGKQVVVCGGEVYVLPREDKKAGDFINRLVEKHPGSTPTITFVPKQGTYILLIQK